MSRMTGNTRLLTLHSRDESQTLIDCARRHYEERPDSTALIFIPSDGSAPREHTIRAFYDGSARYADALSQAGITPGSLVIIVMEHTEALLFAFWGAILHGAIPSMFPFLSDKLDPEQYYQRVQTLIAHSGAAAVIASPAYHGGLSRLLESSGVRVIDANALQIPEGVTAFAGSQAAPDPDQIAFLQHSSGTTGLQKGVALSHQAVLNQIAAYSEAIRLTDSDRIASWLPLYHDMGLIAGFMLPTLQGLPLILMSPFHWVRDPKLLLLNMAAHGGTLAWLPNFAYNFMAGRVRDQQIVGLDLSKVRALINCSEPMFVESHRQFAEKYGNYGLDPRALTTCYAMAENTFAVTQGGIASPVNIDRITRAGLAEYHAAIPAGTEDTALEMLSCGKPIPNCQVRILDSDRRELPERKVGEVAVRSDSMLTEYYRRDDLTRDALFDGWYLTGDFGYLADGELYITGRKKDLIIVGGKNIYPQDIETIAGEIEGVHPGRIVAFGIPDNRLGTEALVVVAESDLDDEDQRDKVARQIRMRVAQSTDTNVGDVLIVEARWLLKTSSGKIARGANRDKYMAEFMP